MIWISGVVAPSSCVLSWCPAAPVSLVAPSPFPFAPPLAAGSAPHAAARVERHELVPVVVSRPPVREGGEEEKIINYIVCINWNNFGPQTTSHLSDFTAEPLNKDTFGTSRFVLCREVVLFQRRFFLIECVYKSTFSLSFVGRFVPFQSVLYRRFHCIQ